MNDLTAAPFGAVLQEMLAELEADEALQARLAGDPVERFRLATQHIVLAERGGPMPRAGHHAYITKPAPQQEPNTPHLDILS